MTVEDRTVEGCRPRLLVVSNLYPPVIVGGYEVECRDAVEQLRSHYDVEILTSTRGRREVSSREPGVHRLLPFVPESRFGVLGAPWHTAVALRRLERFLHGRDYDLVFVWNAVGLPQTVLARLARHHRMAFRICQQWFGGIYAEDLFLRYLRSDRSWRRPWWSKTARLLNRLPVLRTDPDPTHPVAVCWNSEYIRTTAPGPASLPVVHETVVHPISAATTELESIERRPPNSVPVIVYVGRVVDDKGVDIAVGAIAALRRRRGLPARLVIIGTGPKKYAAQLLRQARRERVDDLVDMVGSVRGPDLHAVLGAASAWVVPSRWDEPAPMVALESALAGIPLVASRVGGIPELVQDGEEALLFDRDDVEGCAAALAEVLAGGPAVQRRVERARVRAEELSFGFYSERILAFVEAAIAAIPDVRERPPGVS